MTMNIARRPALAALLAAPAFINQGRAQGAPCLLYTSDAADE